MFTRKEQNLFFILILAVSLFAIAEDSHSIKKPKNLTVEKAIRQALKKEKYLSATAKNIGIAVSGNTVKLSGLVEDEKEIALVEVEVHKVSPDIKIDDQLKSKVTE